MIGVVGPESETRSHIVRSIERAGGEAQPGEASEFTTDTPRLLVAHTEPAVIDTIHAGIAAPIIPLETGPGLPSFSFPDFDDAISTIVNDEYELRRVPLLSVERAGTTIGRALYDAMLVTLEPTSISEYQVSTHDTLEQFRADGVVIATPIGSHGYARAAGGPRVELDTRVVVAVPIAGFSLRTDHWVLSAHDPIDLVCIRDETSVGVQLDGRLIRSIPAHEPITITSSEPCRIVEPT